MGSLSSLKQAVLKWHQYSDVTAVMIGYRLKVLFCTRKNLEIKQATENQALLSCWILHSILRGKNSFYLAVNFYQLMMSSNRQVDLLIQIRTVNILLGLRVKYMLINIAKMIKSVFLISRTLSAKYLLFSTKSSAVRDNGILFSNWVFASCPCDCRTFESPVHQFFSFRLFFISSLSAPWTHHITPHWGSNAGRALIWEKHRESRPLSVRRKGHHLGLHSLARYCMESESGVSVCFLRSWSGFFVLR